jgi:hypothetical protein
MATANRNDVNSAVADDDEAGSNVNVLQQLIISASTQSWMASAIIHMIILVVMALVLGTIHVAKTIGQAHEFEAVEEIATLEPEIEHFEVGDTPIDPTELTTESLTLEAPPVEAQFNDNSPVFEEAGGGIQGAESSFGGLGGFTVAISGLGPVL